MKVSIRESTRTQAKLMAIFTRDDGSKKTVHFGARGYSDFTIHKDSARKQRYIVRHRKRENWDEPTTAGALSRWILWNKPSLKASISDYKKRFGLN